jgi:ribosome-binding protein aMBF1 (putative translation factor)
MVAAAARPPAPRCETFATVHIARNIYVTLTCKREPQMSELTPLSRWARIREPTLASPVRKARYDRTKHQVLITRQILQQIDAERERRGMTKADLAERIGATPSVVRRLFSSESSNPTLGTVLAMLDALDLGMQVRRAPRRRRDASTVPTH